MKFQLDPLQTAKSLEQNGLVICDSLLAADHYLNLKQECLNALQKGRSAQIASGDFNGVRHTELCWIEPEHTCGEQFLIQLKLLGSELGELLRMSLKRAEGHFACYEEGAFYKPHSDNPKGQGNRMLTAVFYFNNNWSQEHQGCFEFCDSGQVIEPLANRLVLFDSRLEHQVLPTTVKRYSIAAWLRKDEL